MNINRTLAISKKAIKDFKRNKRQLLFFLMFPIMTYVFYFAMPSEEGNEMFPIVFLPVNILFCSLTIMASIIAEEKEKGTLRSLIFANVKPIEYFTGNAIVVWILTLLSCSLFIPIINISGINYLYFYLSITLSSICSMILGAAIGVIAKNQMSCNGICAPITIILGMLPTFGALNESFRSVSKYLYTTKFADTTAEILNGLEVTLDYKILLTYLLNFIVCLIIFYFVYRNNKLDD